MWAKIITIKRTKDLNYFSLCALHLFNTHICMCVCVCVCIHHTYAHTHTFSVVYAVINISLIYISYQNFIFSFGHMNNSYRNFAYLFSLGLWIKMVFSSSVNWLYHTIFWLYHQKPDVPDMILNKKNWLLFVRLYTCSKMFTFYIHINCLIV